MNTENKVSMDELIKTYLVIRNEREKIASEWKEKDSAFDNELIALSQQMLTVFNETNSTSIKTGQGRVIKKLKERYVVSDGEHFRNFVMEKNMPELFEARISQSNFKEFLCHCASYFGATATISKW
jgi:retron-type reverse transcriptase